MQDTKTCLICCQNFFPYYFNGQYQFCRFCQRKLTSFRSNIHASINRSLKTNTENYVWKFLP